MSSSQIDTALPDGLSGQAQALASAEISSIELTKATLAAIEAAEPKLNAFRVLRSEAALEEAAAADARIAAGESAPLLGVPVAIKDDTDIVGESTMFGTAGEWPIASSDAELVRRLREAGAIIVGKTHTPEFGQYPFTEGEAFGAARSPWNTDHSPGGSSGGSAAAVAAGLVAAAVGSDGAGSVRIPAAWSNLVGIKPQRGRISTWPHKEAFNGLTCNGPLARTVGDAALFLDVLTGNHPAELHRPVRPAQTFSEAAAREPGKLRIGISYGTPFSGLPAKLDDPVRQRIEALGATLEGLGHSVDGEELSYGLVGLAFVPRGSAGVNEWVQRAPDPELLDERTLSSARNGRMMGGPILAAARASEKLVQRSLGKSFEDFDVIITPTTAKPPAKIGAIDGLSELKTDGVMIAHCPYTYPWNVTGWPGISVPAGFVDGLPVGAQLLGTEGSEPLLLSLAAQLEDELRWHEQRPPAL